MKQKFVLASLFISALLFSQIKHINSGEELDYRIHYGIINAGIAKLSTQNVNYKGKNHLYVKGYGKSTGMVRAFFKVEDHYESYIDTESQLPSLYTRDILEGGYRRNFESVFDFKNKSISLNNKIEKTTRKFDINRDLQDMISAFYYLRNWNHNDLKIGKTIAMDIWIDDEAYAFQLKIIGKELLDTDMGKVECLKIIPMVKSGRIFKSDESVMMWVTNDQNHIPVSMKASLLVGSLKASITSIKNQKYPIKWIK